MTLLTMLSNVIWQPKRPRLGGVPPSLLAELRRSLYRRSPPVPVDWQRRTTSSRTKSQFEDAQQAQAPYWQFKQQHYMVLESFVRNQAVLQEALTWSEDLRGCLWWMILLLKQLEQVDAQRKTAYMRFYNALEESDASRTSSSERDARVHKLIQDALGWVAETARASQAHQDASRQVDAALGAQNQVFKCLDDALGYFLKQNHVAGPPSTQTPEEARLRTASRERAITEARALEDIAGYDETSTRVDAVRILVQQNLIDLAESRQLGGGLRRKHKRLLTSLYYPFGMAMNRLEADKKRRDSELQQIIHRHSDQLSN